MSLVTPAGGTLVDRLLDDAEGLTADAGGMPSVPLTDTAVSDLQLIACGAYSPLTGFMSSDDYTNVVHSAQLAGGTPWTLPITLPVSAGVAASLTPGTRAALRDATDRVVGLIDVADVFRRDLEVEARDVYGTSDRAHPGVRALMASDELAVGGGVRALPAIDGRALTPGACRAEFERRGWSTVVGFQTRNPIHRAHEYLTKVALESADGLLIHPLVGPTKDDDVPVGVRMQCYEVLLDEYYPRARVVLSGFPAAMRYAGPREAVFHGLVRRNYGCSHFIIGRDAAGVGSYYGPYDAQRLYDELGGAERLGFTALKFDHAFFCRACDALTSSRTCPHDDADHVVLSGRGGRDPAARLFDHATVRVTEPGITVWFTGLSGAGKSTIATHVARHLTKHGHAVEMLDGDVVRRNLSAGLGYSKEDRDTNIRRIGFVAELLTRNGVVVLVAAISPYRSVREEVEGRIGNCVEVHVHCPIDVLVERDGKGLYRRALAGEIDHFTGVSDPYEEPAHPHLRLDTSTEPVEASVAKVLALLEDRGYG